mgnify:CR=1 FL=1
MRKSKVVAPVLLAAVVAGAGCVKDPTEGKTAAKVAEPQQVEKAPEGAEAADVAKKTERLTVDRSRSKVGFVGAKVTAQHVGVFQEFTGSIALVDGKLEGGNVEFEVQTASVVADDGNPRLEGHLRSPDFFEVEKFPTAKFVSTSITAGSDAEGMTHTVTGNLTIRGTTKSVTFPAKVEVTPSEVRASTEFGINRNDFGIVYPGKADDLIKDNVLIQVDFVAPRAAATAQDAG